MLPDRDSKAAFRTLGSAIALCPTDWYGLIGLSVPYGHRIRQAPIGIPGLSCRGGPSDYGHSPSVPARRVGLNAKHRDTFSIRLRSFATSRGRGDAGRVM